MGRSLAQLCCTYFGGLIFKVLAEGFAVALLIVSWGGGKRGARRGAAGNIRCQRS